MTEQPWTCPYCHTELTTPSVPAAANDHTQYVDGDQHQGDCPQRTPIHSRSCDLGDRRPQLQHPTRLTSVPTASPRLCPGCRQQVRGRCPNCTPHSRRDTDRHRGNSNSRGYNHHWRTVTRPAFLRDHPLCTLCGALAEIPDHWPETRASLIRRQVPDPDAPHRLRPLCTDCHNRHGAK